MGQGRAGQGRTGVSQGCHAHLCEIHWEATGVPQLKHNLAVYVLPALGLGSSCSLIEAGNALVQGSAEAHLLLTAQAAWACLQNRSVEGRAGRGRAKGR